MASATVVQLGGRFLIKKFNKFGILTESLATTFGRTATMGAKFLPSRVPSVARRTATFAPFKDSNAVTSIGTETRVENREINFNISSTLDDFSADKAHNLTGS